MPFLSLKYTIWCICVFLIYFKLESIKVSKSKLCVTVILSILIGLVSEVLFNEVFYVHSFFVYISLIFCIYLLYKKPFITTFVSGTISFALSSMMMLVSVCLSAFIPISYVFLNYFDVEDQKLWQAFISRIILGCIQLLVMQFFFRIKRFKALYKKAYKNNLSDTVLYTSVVITIVTILFTILSASYAYITMGVMILLTLLIIFILVWKSKVTNVYKEKVIFRNNELLQQKIDEQNKINERLKYHNDELSKIIHKDNKIIPSMEIAVKTLLSEDYTNTQAEVLLKQISELSADRYNAVENYENENQNLSKTGILSVDAVVSYIRNRCAEEDINFSFIYNVDLSQIIDKIISEKELHTLIADLCENAVIAVKGQNLRNILLSIGMVDDLYSIDVFDSGIEFTPKTVFNIGIERYTTHRKTGGSGIGMMTVFEILNGCKASFTLDEALSINNYSKKVGVLFDEKNNFYLHTKRPELTQITVYRDNVVFL